MRVHARSRRKKLLMAASPKRVSAQKDDGEVFDPVEAERELERIEKGLEAHRHGAEFDLDAAERAQERIRKWLEKLLAKQEATRVI